MQQNIAIRIAGNLPENIRAAVEQLLGRPVAANEEIKVIATPKKEHSLSPERAAAARALKEHFDRRAEAVKDIPDCELDAVIDEACDHVRHNRA